MWECKVASGRLRREESKSRIPQGNNYKPVGGKKLIEGRKAIILG